MRTWLRVLTVGVLCMIVGIVAVAVSPANPEGLFEAVSLVGVIGLSIGSALIAIALAAGLVVTQVFGVDVADLIEALLSASPLFRSEQTVDITIESSVSGVHIAAEHRFDLLLRSWRPRKLPLRMYTDGRKGDPCAGGFTSVVEPGPVTLEGEALARWVDDAEERPRFEKEYDFERGKRAKFTITTYAERRSADRLIWTVDHISTDFAVRIRDHRVDAAPLVAIKINHHHAGEIADSINWHRDDGGRVAEFTFHGPVLPFQGFEIQWVDRLPDWTDTNAGAGGEVEAAQADATG